MFNVSSFLISATSSGSGKTTITLGILAALKKRGLHGQPFKCGPDYIDTKYHDLASGNRSVNLDLFLSSTHHVNELYQKYGSKADVCVTEGVMGLFDGYDRMKGSSAQIAELLDIPVILVVNAKSMAYSSAALLYGYKNFYKNIKVIGVIFNFVASESHYLFLKEACADVGLQSLGYLPKNTEVAIPSRHLGLKLDDEYRYDDFVDRVADIVEKHIDLDKLLSITQRNSISPPSNIAEPLLGNLNIAVADDDAFNFTYHENIAYLRKIGTVTFFSPINDTALPKADLVYLPGGYPELFAKELSCNESMLQSIRAYIENGGKLLAECGGMMYLSSSITDEHGMEYAMANIFDQKATMKNMKLKLGYRQFEYNGLHLKGHEFHYSSIEGNIASVLQQYNAKQQNVDTKLLRYKNAIAGYTHLYWGETANLLNLFNCKT